MHTCKAMLIKCMDFRITKETMRFLEENSLMGDCDIVSIAGASKELIDGDEGAKELLLKQIKISQELHKIEELVLLHHSDCGAYKSSFNFSDSEEEKEKQFTDMARAEEIIKENFPGLKVRKVWAQLLTDGGEKIEFTE